MQNANTTRNRSGRTCRPCAEDAAPTELGNRYRTGAVYRYSAPTARATSCTFPPSSVQPPRPRQCPVRGRIFVDRRTVTASQPREGRHCLAAWPCGAREPWDLATTVTSPDSPGQSSSRAVFIPKTPETFAYDADGNLTSDGRWIYGWDAENRLISMQANTTNGPQQKLVFQYDWQGRRIRKQVWPNTSGSGSPSTDTLFVYDHWNLLGSLSALALQESFVWGLDISGRTSPEGDSPAGGVGGLLFVDNWQSPVAQDAVAYDGNGDVVALEDVATDTVAARYEYGPFGEVVRATGPMAKANPLRRRAL